MKNITVFVLLLSLFVISIASAQGGRNMGHGRNNSHFAGRQNSIQNNYYPARPFNNNMNWSPTNQPAFALFDLNNDGIISESEFSDARNNRISSRAQDGYLMQNIANSLNFADLDLNTDGQITIDELTAHQRQYLPMNRNSRPRRGGSW